MEQKNSLMVVYCCYSVECLTAICIEQRQVENKLFACIASQRKICWYIIRPVEENVIVEKLVDTKYNI